MCGMTDEERELKDKPAPSEEAADNPLHKKLGIRAGLTGAVVAPPEESGLLSPLPEGFTVLASVDELTASEGLFDYVHVLRPQPRRPRQGLSPAARQGSLRAAASGSPG